MDDVQPVAGTTTPSGFASKDECEKLVDHIDGVFALSGKDRELFRAPNQVPNWHQSRVQECTIKVDAHDRDCLMRSHDIDTSARCNSSFFADTMQAYRNQ